MRFEVPQFIDVEDKIFGPLTWKQFIYVAGGAGAGFVLFIYLPLPLFLIIAGPIIALAAGLAFYEFNNRPLSLLLESMVYYFKNARLYLWKKQDQKPGAPRQQASAGQVYTPPASANTIANLSRQLEINAIQKK